MKRKNKPQVRRGGRRVFRRGLREISEVKTIRAAKKPQSRTESFTEDSEKLIFRLKSLL